MQFQSTRKTWRGYKFSAGLIVPYDAILRARAARVVGIRLLLVPVFLIRAPPDFQPVSPCLNFSSRPALERNEGIPFQRKASATLAPLLAPSYPFKPYPPPPATNPATPRFYVTSLSRMVSATHPPVYSNSVCLFTLIVKARHLVISPFSPSASRLRLTNTALFRTRINSSSLYVTLETFSLYMFGSVWIILIPLGAAFPLQYFATCTNIHFCMCVWVCLCVFGGWIIEKAKASLYARTYKLPLWRKRMTDSNRDAHTRNIGR